MSGISGFPELLPREQIAFNGIVGKIREQFELFGFSPIDTPAVEKVSTLLSKGNDNEIYGIHRLADPSEDKSLALRFDLTVPLARYVTEHCAKLTFPYKRYHIAPVWRGERPQRGRYRQFYQCDVDIIGNGDVPLFYDAEIVTIGYTVLSVIGVSGFTMFVNNRLMLSGLLKSFGISEDNIPEVLRIIDKAEKISAEDLQKELLQKGIRRHDVDLLLGLQPGCSPESLQDLCSHEDFQQGLREVIHVIGLAKEWGVPSNQLQFHPTLARGLQYYTGTVVETQLLNHPELGSICSGGRYAHLAENFSTRKFPGVGISVGISRLLPFLLEQGVVKASTETPASVLVTMQNPDLLSYYMKIAQNLRAHGINTEIYLAPSPLETQMKYADRKGFSYALIANTQESDQEHVVVRFLQERTQQLVHIRDVAKMLSALKI